MEGGCFHNNEMHDLKRVFCYHTQAPPSSGINQTRTKVNSPQECNPQTGALQLMCCPLQTDLDSTPWHVNPHWLPPHQLAPTNVSPPGMCQVSDMPAHHRFTCIKFKPYLQHATSPLCALPTFHLSHLPFLTGMPSPTDVDLPPSSDMQPPPPTTLKS